jgi:L-asparaginase
MSSAIQHGPMVAILGTGGTIAGVSSSGDDRHYQAAQLSVADLVAAVPALAQVPLRAQQVAQVDSKDMGWPVWRELLRAVQGQLDDPQVGAVVITHGTDTLEETSLLLHLLLAPKKPVVLVAAMRPATSAQADGPGNLRNAVRVAQWAAGQGLGGVVVVMHGRVWAGMDVRKTHSWAIDAFDGGLAAPLMTLDEAPAVWDIADTTVSLPWPAGLGWGGPQASWPGALPAVALITSHGDVDGMLVDVWRAATTGDRRGLVVAGTGHGTLHQSLEAALWRARADGVVVWRSTRVARGGILSDHGAAETWPSCGALTPAQARLALALALQWRGPQATSLAQAMSASTGHA